ATGPTHANCLALRLISLGRTTGERRGVQRASACQDGDSMRRASRPANGLRFAICTLAAALTLVAIGRDPADARGRRWRHHHARGAPYHPPYAAIVVDANSGRVLHESNADSLRHPASLTKIM